MSADDARMRILMAAGQIFAEKGFQATTVREICQAAEVNLAGVNYYFGDKETLYIEAVRQANPMTNASIPSWPQGTPPEERLRDYIRQFFHRLLGTTQAAWQSRLMLREILEPTRACEALTREYFSKRFAILLEILDDLLPPETPRHRREQTAFSIVGQCVYYRTAGEVVKLLISEDQRRAHYQADDLADHVAELILAALGAGPPLGQRDDVSRRTDVSA